MPAGIIHVMTCVHVDLHMGLSTYTMKGIKVDPLLETFMSFYRTQLQIREGTEDNSKIIFLISQWKHML